MRHVRTVGLLTPVFALMWSMVAAEPVTVLYDDQVITVAETLADPNDLWVLPEDLPRINGFELKPEGACFGALCVPVLQDRDSELFVTRSGQGWFNVSELARKLEQAFVFDADHHVWSFGQIPLTRREFLRLGMAPDFELPNRDGEMVRLSDFRGKKLLLMTWASWLGCRYDLHGWQEVYEELRDENFEIIVVAQDALGEAATAEWHDQEPLSYTTLIDVTHRVSSLYNLVNVPSGVWVDEEGRIRRINENTYSQIISLRPGSSGFGTDDYRPAVFDWVRNGDNSEYVWSRDRVVSKIRQRTSDETLGEPTFKLGVYFYNRGDEALGRNYWEKAQRLSPDSWNFHRQDWNLTEGLAGPKYREKRAGLGDKPYHPSLDLPERP